MLEKFLEWVTLVLLAPHEFSQMAGTCPGPPPLEIEKPKKKRKVIRANFKLFHLYFATF